LKLIKQVVKSLIKRLIGVLLLYFAKNDYRLVCIIIMIINVGIKMHFNFDVRAIKIVFGAYIVQIIVSSFARKNPGKYGCELRWAHFSVIA
jgi:hypothetical protein